MIDGLRTVRTKELRAALERCAEEGVEQIDAHRLRGWGMRALALAIAPLGSVPTPMLLTLVQCVLAEREVPKPQVDLVWTGPHPRTSTVRDTYVVVRDLFRSAQAEVLVAGYRFDHGEELLEPLRERARAGVRVAIFLDLAEKARSPGGVEGLVLKAGQAFLRDNWAAGVPAPELYYYWKAVDPEEHEYASMHAKCVVVDCRRALVGSANFTSRARTRNVEVGVMIEDGRIATELAGHWWSGVQGGAFRRIEVGDESEGAPLE